MPLDILNKTYTSVVKVIDPGVYNVTLNDLTLDIGNTYLLDAGIKRIIWSTNGNITITRNNNPLVLYDQGSMMFTEMDYILYDNSNQNINISITSGGTVFIELGKDVQSLFDLFGYVSSSTDFSDGQPCFVYTADIFSDGQPFDNINV